MTVLDTSLVFPWAGSHPPLFPTGGEGQENSRFTPGVSGCFQGLLFQAALGPFSLWSFCIWVISVG